MGPVAAGIVAAPGTPSGPGVGMRGGENQNKGASTPFPRRHATEAKMQRDEFTRSRMSPRAHNSHSDAVVLGAFWFLADDHMGIAAQRFASDFTARVPVATA